MLSSAVRNDIDFLYYKYKVMDYFLIEALDCDALFQVLPINFLTHCAEYQRLICDPALHLWLRFLRLTLCSFRVLFDFPRCGLFVNFGRFLLELYHYDDN